MKYEENEIKNQLRILEDRNRRNNLRIDGIAESENESWEECEEKIKKVLKQEMNINNVNIERAHRMGKKNTNRPRTIIFKLLNWKEKEHIIRNSYKLKDTGVYINEDFSAATMEIRKGLLEKMKQQRQEGKYSIIV